jgi:hypothetical protein
MWPKKKLGVEIVHDKNWMFHILDKKFKVFLITYSSTIIIYMRPCATIPNKQSKHWIRATN